MSWHVAGRLRHLTLHTVLVASVVSRFLRPTTDLGVAAQLAALVLVVGLAAWRVWHRPEWRLVVLGAGLVLLGAMGIRAAH